VSIYSLEPLALATFEAFDRAEEDELKNYSIEREEIENA
jgi:hypothetical protein